MEVIKQLIGRLHPIVVHLPIGFIILGLLLRWYDSKRNAFSNAIPLIFLWGAYAAILACITGYMQYLGEGFAFETVKWHLWLGLATALFSFLLYFRFGSSERLPSLKNIPVLAITLLMLVLISYTGHLGGTITHGPDYLVEPLPNTVKKALGIDTFEKREIVLSEDTYADALIYDDVIGPILNNACVSCHNPKKSKGDLMLHSETAILKGGENGDVLIAHNADQSELTIRVHLPIDDDDHMPPEGKAQPSKEERALLSAWIDAGHPFDKTIGQSGLAKELFQSFFPKELDTDYPPIEVPEAAFDSIATIEAYGVHVDPIDKISNFLKVSCINKPHFTDTDFAMLKPLAQQIAILDLGGTKVSDAIFEKLTTLPNLTLLKLDHTLITGENIEQLGALAYLKIMNLTFTQFEERHLQKLEAIPGLKKVYLYNTRTNDEGVRSLRSGTISIDYGNYQLPQIASDSIIY